MEEKIFNAGYVKLARYFMYTVIFITIPAKDIYAKDSFVEKESPVTATHGGNVDDSRGYLTTNHPTRATGGVVVSQSHPASDVGAFILRSGGNAVDAAVAVGFAEAVTLPRAGNLGGGGYMMIYLADKQKVTSFDYYGSAPKATTSNLLLDENGKFNRAASVSWKSIAVPGTVAAFYEAHRKYGRLSWKKVLQPAIDLAEKGYRLSDDEAMIRNWAKPTLIKDDETRRYFFKKDGSSYRPGDLVRWPDLAWSLKLIARDGADAFYKGEIAKRIVASSHAQGGIINAQDLADYKVRELPPLWSSYRGVEFALPASPASGATLGEILNILEVFPLEKWGQGSAQTLHIVADAIRLAVSDRGAFSGGWPQYVAPSKEILEKSYAQTRAKLIDYDRMTSVGSIKRGDPYVAHSPDTTHFSVVDGEGNIVSNTYTLSNNFGSAVIASGTGILLNSSLNNFDWGGNPNSPNAPAPGKRLVSTITPFIAFKDKKPWIVAGAPGGSSIVPALAQFMVNVIDFKLNIAEATQRPRINASRDGKIFFEESMSVDTLDKLKKMGYTVAPFITQTSIQSIEIDKDGLVYGSADPRRPDSTVAGVNVYR